MKWIFWTLLYFSITIGFAVFVGRFCRLTPSPPTPRPKKEEPRHLDGVTAHSPGEEKRDEPTGSNSDSMVSDS